MNATPDERRGKGPRLPRADAGADKKRAEAGAREKQTGGMPDNCRLAARLREETTELLALLPAARKAAAGGPAGGETALDGMARAAYRVLRIAENMAACASLAAGAVKATPICVTALAAAYVNGAAGVCRTAVFRQAWPREPLWSPGCARLFAAALGNLLANAVQYGGERPAISVRAQKCGAMLLLTVADSGDGYGGEYGAKGSIGGGMKDCAKYGAENGASDSIEAERQDPAYSMGEEAAEDGAARAVPPKKEEGLGLAVVRQYAAAFGGQLLTESAPGCGARFTLCLPLCAPGGAIPAHAVNAKRMQGTAGPLSTRKTPPLPPDYIADRFSPLYVQLAPVCDLPL